jgi:hypothetical protein
MDFLLEMNLTVGLAKACVDENGLEENAGVDVTVFVLPSLRRCSADEREIAMQMPAVARVSRSQSDHCETFLYCLGIFLWGRVDTKKA